MTKSTMFKRYRFPPAIIQYAVWLYYRFNVSHGDIENLLAQRGIIVTHESIRLWCNKFGTKYAARLHKRHQGYGDTFFIDNRAELSQQPTKVRERGMRKFKSVRESHRFLNVHAAVYNLFNLCRHLVSAKIDRFFRSRAFVSWNCAAA
jgi:transposase-like protein